MKCVIIAAGKGERLQEKGTSKPLVNFLGLPLIERPVTHDNWFEVAHYNASTV